MKLLNKLFDLLFESIEPKCKICKDKKHIEVPVMGTDTDIVECPYCEKNKL